MTSAPQSGAAGFFDLLAEDELPPGVQKAVRIAGHEILLLRTEENIYAVENICPHALLPLLGGRITDDCITCPRHGARFELKTGKPTNAIAKQSLKIYAVQITAGMIQVQIA